MGPYEHRADCNSNGIHDQDDIAGGTSSDCNGNGIPDACERWQPFRGFALVPVSATGSYELSPECNEIVVGVGERVTLEVHVGAWDPDLDGQPRLGLYSARIDTSSFTSGQRGSLDPLRIPCEDDAQCRGQCAVGGFCDHQSSIFVDTSDPDWPYFGKSSGYGASSSGFVVSAFAADAADAAVDDGAPRYGGTLVLDVSTDAAGTFTLRFDSSAVATKLRNENNTADIELVDLLPARIVVLADCNANGIPDDEDIAGGTSGDCNQNGVPDECEAIGACDSPDTDGDGVCDDCDRCPGFDDAVDSDLDGVPDGCDLCPGVDDANCSIPATSVWGLILFGILVMTAGSLILRKSGSRSPRLRVPEAIAAVSCD
jgi:hypothetical protein